MAELTHKELLPGMFVPTLPPYVEHGPSDAYLPSGRDGQSHVHAWAELQMAARRLHYAEGSQTHIHHHLAGEDCNELCDLFPPMPEAEHEPQVVRKVEPTVCNHGMSLDRDCGECSQEARMGLRKLSRPDWGGLGELEQ